MDLRAGLARSLVYYCSNHFEDLDLVAGLALEKPVPGSFYGPTAVCIMGEQYYRLKYADRFWFEHLYHPGAFSKGKL